MGNSNRSPRAGAGARDNRMDALGASLVHLSLSGHRLFASGMLPTSGGGSGSHHSSASKLRQQPQQQSHAPHDVTDLHSDIPDNVSTMDGFHTNNKLRGTWTSEQDDALRLAVEKYGAKNWKAIALEVPGERTHIQCLQRWSKVLKPGLIKGPWTEDQDDLLRYWVPRETRGNWVAVAGHVPGRTAKQCRERWSLCLDPTIRKDSWSAEEDALLLYLHDEYGNAWAQISQHLPGRTENASKSRFKTLERRREREWSTEEDAIIVRGKQQEKKYDEIARMMPRTSRSKNAIKARWMELVQLNPGLRKLDSSSSVQSGGSSGLLNLDVGTSSASQTAPMMMTTTSTNGVPPPPSSQQQQSSAFFAPFAGGASNVNNNTSNNSLLASRTTNGSSNNSFNSLHFPFIGQQPQQPQPQLLQQTAAAPMGSGLSYNAELFGSSFALPNVFPVSSPQKKNGEGSSHENSGFFTSADAENGKRHKLQATLSSDLIRTAKAATSADPFAEDFGHNIFDDDHDADLLDLDLV